MAKKETHELFPREYLWMDEKEAKYITIKITTSFTNEKGETLYILPSSTDLQKIKDLQDKWQKHLMMDFADMFLSHEEDLEKKWEEKK